MERRYCKLAVTSSMAKGSGISIRSYEKLITEHQDKIANPLKHYPHWNTLDPRRQDALINKRWPAEIQCYTEQKDVLQTLLDQRK